MKTEKLYYLDPYMKSFTATVISCEKCSDCYAVVLDKTAFFPEEGGQYADKGTISGIDVLDVTEREGVIYHKVSTPFEVGAIVCGCIDFDERFEKMQCHTAEHILSGIIHKEYGFNNVGFHLGAQDVTMDISAPLSHEQLCSVEKMANEAIFKNVAVKAVYPTADELKSMEYRSKIDFTDGVRVVVIDGYDSCACCAPHVNYTGEIGIVKILDAEGLRGGMRIHITAGRRAFDTFCKMQHTLSKISRIVSLPRLECAEGVERLSRENERLSLEYKRARLVSFEREGELVVPADNNSVIHFADASYDELRAVANRAADKIGGILVLLSGEEGSYKFVCASHTVDLRKEMPKINAALSGKGGGNSSMVQGSFSASMDDIVKYFD